MDELEEIKKKKMEKMMSEINKPHEPTIEQPGKPIIITDATVDAASNQYPLLILDCWAEWCGPCRMIGPIIEELAAEMKGRAVFGKLNVDEKPLLVQLNWHIDDREGRFLLRDTAAQKNSVSA